jgi:teichuronic acid exporter
MNTINPPTVAVAQDVSNEQLDHFLASGIAWTALCRWSAQIVSWAATFYAARLLLPSDYGLVSMAGIAIGLARLVEGFGLDAILVQDRTIAGDFQARLAGFVLGVGAALALIFVLVAPAVAGFFDEPQVTGIVRLMSVLLILDALQVVPRSLMQRSLRFGRLAVVTLVQLLVTSAVLVVSAAAGFGYWALVLNSLGGALAATFLLMLWAPHAIAFPRDLASLARPLLQGWRMLASRMAWYGYSSADQTIIGRVIGKDMLGAYSFALTFSTIAQDEVGSIVSRVAPGIFSAVQNRRDELRRYFLLLTEFLTIVSFPVSLGVALIADLMIPVILGDGWGATIVPLRLLCVYSAFIASQTLVSHVILWTGQFRVHMWLSILTLVTMPLALFAGAHQAGLPGVAWAWAVVFPVTTAPAFYVAFRTIDIRLRDWLGALAPAAVSAALMIVLVIGMRIALSGRLSMLLEMIVAIGLGAVIYAASLWLLFRPRMRAMIALGRTIRRS